MTVVSANLFILAPLIITIGHFRAAAVGPADRWQQRSERESRAEYINSWAVKILGGPAVADDIARRNGYENIGLAAGLPDVYHFQLSIRPDTSYTSSLALEKFVEFAEQQFLQQLVPKSYATPEDPLFEKQWNLLNTGQNGEQYKGKDLKVEKAWLQGLTGCNVTVTVVDEGIEFRHPDLWPNFAPLVSYGFLEGDVDPTKLDHGTRCSGVIAAMKDNAICGVGVAHECTLGSVRLLVNDDGKTDLEQASSLSYARDIVDIYSNSYGPPDTGSNVVGPRTLTKLILEMGATEGRNGKGSIHVWAGGNGGDKDDCGADGYASSIYTIAVGAIREDGSHTKVDEKCSAKMVVAYTTDNGGNNAIVTTDVGQASCELQFGGTSAATPMVSGAIALALEANPNLTWRDVQYLIAYTANPHLTAGPLTRNGAGLAVSRQYGFGVMDAEAMVTRARHWINVPSQMKNSVTSVSQQETLEDTYIFATADYNGPILYLEHLVVQMSINTQNVKRGDLQIELTSPSGTLSVLLHPRPLDNKPGEYVDWPFMSVMFWGEDPTGQWTLNIRTGDVTGVAVVSRVEFHFYGVSRVPEAVANIPDQCHSDCSRGCAREGSNFCDSCVNLRNAYTLECINECPPGYTERSGYCYDASLPTKVCNSPLKNKGNFTGCVAAGFTDCCTNGHCTSSLSSFFSCFCDSLCYKFDDCCEDVTQIGCSVENVYQPFPFIKLGVTPGVKTRTVGHIPPSVDVSFPFRTSLESTVYVLDNGSFVFAPVITNEDVYSGVVAPFLSVNDPSSGEISYEVHEGNISEHIFYRVNMIINEHEHTNFSGNWLLVATWNNVKDLSNNYTNTFQGILATDSTSSYAIFTYFCGNMSFSNPGHIGVFYARDDTNITHGATYREFPHFISCLNLPESPWVNVVFEITRSEDVSNNVPLFLIIVVSAASAVSGVIVVIVLIICCKVILKFCRRQTKVQSKAKYAVTKNTAKEAVLAATNPLVHKNSAYMKPGTGQDNISHCTGVSTRF